MMIRGKFITLEGGEGTGKSTQAEYLEELLRRNGVPVLRLRSPGGTASAEKIRAILKEKTEGDDLLPETELLLFCACHSQMTRNAVLPALEKGVWVVCDRYTDSTVVYQGAGRGVDRARVEDLCAFACGNVRPDLTLLLDLDVRLGLQRAGGRADTAGDRFDSETETFHRSVRNGFLNLAKEDPERIRILPASGTAEEVQEAIRRTLNDVFGLELL